MKKSALPKWAERFLNMICPEELLEEIEGDLLQRYQINLKEHGKNYARRKLILNTLAYCRPGILFRNKFSFHFNRLNMLGSYFTLAGRRITRNKVFSAINVIGLSVALAAFFFIIGYASFETSYEDFHSNRDRVYRVALEQYENDILKNSSAKNYPAVCNFLNDQHAEIKAATRFVKIPANTGFLFGHQDKVFHESGGHLNVDSNFFKVFPSLLMRGDLTTALKEPHSIIISESIAKKVFGDGDPIGQRLDRLEENGDAPLVVTGILKDIPENSHFHMKFISRLEDTWPEIIEDDWNPILIFNYALLQDDADPESVALAVNNMFTRAAKDEPRVKGAKAFLQPLSQIHLESQLKDEFEGNGSRALVLLVFAIGVAILVIGWINYINIETSRLIRRIREIGVRRIIGSRKSDVLLQCLIEFVCINFVAIVLAAGIIIVMQPVVVNATGISGNHWYTHSPDFWWIGLFIFIAGSLITGIYPALFLIRLNPATSLKGKFVPSKSNRFIKKPLLVLQFSASLILVTFLLIINAQLDHLRNSNRKIDTDQVIALRNPIAYKNQEITDKHSNFKQLEDKLLQHAGVEMVTTSSAIPGTEIGFTYVDLIKRTLNDPYDPTRYKTLFAGEKFIPAYGIKLIAGRNFERDDSPGVPWEKKEWNTLILNEKAVRSLGFSSAKEAVDQTVKFKALDEFEDYRIIGVIEDYHHEAVKKEALPMIIKLNFDCFQQVYYSVRLQSQANPQKAIRDLEESWKAVFPEYPFEYFFIDQYYDQQFKSEEKFSSVFTLFSSVAIFIACLGIIGMAYFEVMARVKEISVRKILGASVVNLMMLLSKDQMRCIIVACAISIPLIWYGAGQWLSAYPTRLKLSPEIMILPLCIVSAIVMTISLLQTAKAMRGNPVDHLRDE